MSPSPEKHREGGQIRPEASIASRPWMKGGLAGFDRLQALYSVATVSLYGEFPKVNPGSGVDSPVSHLSRRPSSARRLPLTGPAPCRIPAPTHSELSQGLGQRDSDLRALKQWPDVLEGFLSRQGQWWASTGTGMASLPPVHPANCRSPPHQKPKRASGQTDLRFSVGSARGMWQLEW